MFPGPVQAPVEAPVPARRRLDFDRHESRGRFTEHVHFRAVVAPPVVRTVVAARVAQKGADLVQDERFHQRSPLFRRRRIGQAARQRPHDARVEEIELALPHLPGRGLQLPGRQPVPDQRVGQNREVALDGPAVDAGVAGDGRGVGRLRVLAGGDLQEPREGAEVAGQRFGLHFLHQIGLGVRAQVIFGMVAGDSRRQRAVRERPLDVEREVQLGRHEGEHRRRDGAAREQIDAAPP